MQKRYWVKTNLHKDGTAQWDGVIGKAAAKEKIAELKSQDYNPMIDHTMTEHIKEKN